MIQSDNLDLKTCCETADVQIWLPLCFMEMHNQDLCWMRLICKRQEESWNIMPFLPLLVFISLPLNKCCVKIFHSFRCCCISDLKNLYGCFCLSMPIYVHTMYTVFFFLEHKFPLLLQPIIVAVQLILSPTKTF